MLTEDVNRIKKRLKEVGFDALSENEKKVVIEMNRDLFVIPIPVADPASGIVKNRYILDWHNITWDDAYKTLKKNKRI